MTTTEYRPKEAHPNDLQAFYKWCVIKGHYQARETLENYRRMLNGREQDRQEEPAVSNG